MQRPVPVGTWRVLTPASGSVVSRKGRLRACGTYFVLLYVHTSTAVNNQVAAAGAVAEVAKTLSRWPCQ